MQIHEITKRKRTDEGILDGIKAGITKAITTTKNAALNPLSWDKFNAAQAKDAAKTAPRRQAQAQGMLDRINANAGISGDNAPKITRQTGQSNTSAALDYAIQQEKTKIKNDAAVPPLEAEFEKEFIGAAPDANQVIKVINPKNKGAYYKDGKGAFGNMAASLGGAQDPAPSSTGGTTTPTPTGQVHTANPNNPNNAPPVQSTQPTQSVPPTAKPKPGVNVQKQRPKTQAVPPTAKPKPGVNVQKQRPKNRNRNKTKNESLEESVDPAKFQSWIATRISGFQQAMKDASVKAKVDAAFSQLANATVANAKELFQNYVATVKGGVSYLEQQGKADISQGTHGSSEVSSAQQQNAMTQLRPYGIPPEELSKLSTTIRSNPTKLAPLVKQALALPESKVRK